MGQVFWNEFTVELETILQTVEDKPIADATAPVLKFTRSPKFILLTIGKFLMELHKILSGMIR